MGKHQLQKKTMNSKIIFGISKILLAVLILFYSFTAQGPQKPLGIWIGCVIAFPLILWGILDFVKKTENTEENEENENEN